MKEWQVEDAGGGCRAFSEVVVLLCEQTGEAYFTRLPLTWKNGTSLEEKACSLVAKMIADARVSRTDHILVCSGNIFHAFHNWLTENGYDWEMSKIDGQAHAAAEDSFHRQVVDAGFPADIRLVERNYRDYYRRVERWVAADPLRHVYFKDYEARRKPAVTRYILKGNGNHSRSCLKCRQKIKPYTPLVLYRSRENGRRFCRYFHPDCSPVEPFKSTLENVSVNWNSCQIDGIILNAREIDRKCEACGQPVTPGDRIFYGYLNGQLVAGHAACFRDVGKRRKCEDKVQD